MKVVVIEDVEESARTIADELSDAGHEVHIYPCDGPFTEEAVRAWLAERRIDSCAAIVDLGLDGGRHRGFALAHGDWARPLFFTTAVDPVPADLREHAEFLGGAVVTKSWQSGYWAALLA